MFTAKGTDFYFAYGTSSAVVLPVSITAFSVAQQAGITKLEWTTASETNNSGFGIERSSNGVDFAQISFVASEGEGGNSNLVLNYTTTDAAPLAGIGYYKLRQVDIDGHVTYSSVKSVTSFREAMNYRVFPNPATNLINIHVPNEGNYSVELFSIDGKRLQVSQLAAGSGILSFAINKTNVPNYIYSLKVTKWMIGKV